MDSTSLYSIFRYSRYPKNVGPSSLLILFGESSQTYIYMMGTSDSYRCQGDGCVLVRLSQELRQLAVYKRYTIILKGQKHRP